MPKFGAINQEKDVKTVFIGHVCNKMKETSSPLPPAPDQTIREGGMCV